MKPTEIEGAWVVDAPVFGDERGSFSPWFIGSEFADTVGHDLALGQANCSVSSRGVLRGVHFADVPPGQAKYVTCVAGSILDVVVDIRVGSPTYGSWLGIRLDGPTSQRVPGQRSERPAEQRALYLAEGLGHAFLALTDGATVVYLCSTGYAPEREHGVHPLDPAIGIEWPTDQLGVQPILSEKDAAAPTLDQARAAGLLPRYR